MATYAKSLQKIEVTTRRGNKYTAQDTVDKMIATQALSEFLSEKPMHILNDPKDFIPFEAVELVEVTHSVGSFDREDAYCRAGSSTVCDAKACEANTEC